MRKTGYLTKYERECLERKIFCTLLHLGAHHKINEDPIEIAQQFLTALVERLHDSFSFDVKEEKEVDENETVL